MARSLGISERKLWELTQRGAVPHVRLGTAKLYPIHDVREWLSGLARKGVK